MKIFFRSFVSLIAISICISLVSCDLDFSKNENNTENERETTETTKSTENIVYFFGDVLEIYDGSILVLPSERSSERQSCGDAGIYVSTVVNGKNIAPRGLKKGSCVRIGYNGLIAETYPPQIFYVYSIESPSYPPSPPDTSTDNISEDEPINETLISCENTSIYAERFFLDSLESMPTDDPDIFTAVQGCGDGAYSALIDPEHVFPSIEKNGDVDILISTFATIERIYIAKPVGGDIEHTVISLNDLNALSSGEYFIVLWATFYRNNYGSYQSYTRYEDVFKLIVE